MKQSRKDIRPATGPLVRSDIQLEETLIIRALEESLEDSTRGPGDTSQAGKIRRLLREHPTDEFWEVPG